MTYATEALLDGAQRQARMAAGIEALADALAGVGISEAPFGQVPSVARLVAGLTSARDRQSASAMLESDRRDDVAGRVRAAAGIGAVLTDLTTSVASSPAAAPVPGLVGEVTPR